MVDDNELKADIEDGYTKISNLILEVLAIADLTGVQKSICLFLFRRTYGWDKKEDRISLKEFAQATGSSKSYVSRQLKELIKNKVILRTSHEPGKTPTYTFNTRVEQWGGGCVSTQQLNKNTTQGLYKRTTQGLCKRTTPEQPSSTDTIGFNRGPKESIRESNKERDTLHNVIDINLHNRDTEDEDLAESKSKSKLEKVMTYARQQIVTNQLAYENLIVQDLEKHGIDVLKIAIDLAVAQEEEKENYTRGDPTNGVDIGSWRFIQCFISDAKKKLKGGSDNGANQQSDKHSRPKDYKAGAPKGFFA